MPAVSYRLEADVAVLSIANPPVNALSLPVRTALMEGLTRAAADDAVAAIVLTGSDGTFKVSFAQLYQGTLQLGLVTVPVTGPGGEAFDTQFMVIPPGAPLDGGPQAANRAG